MKVLHRFGIIVLCCGLVALAACSHGPEPAGQPAGKSQTWLGSVIDRAMDKASVELANKNISVSGDNTPKAEITPRGDLLIDGKPVSLTPAQRKQVLAYRQQVVALARQGIAVGKQGATLGVNAASQAIAGALSGKSEQEIRDQVEAQATGIRQAAAKICDSLPRMMESQQELARAVPAFKPYADITPARIAKCRRDTLKDHGDNH